MTDEEMAEKYKESKRHKCFRADIGKIQIEYEAYLNNLKEAYLAGLEADRPKWHDLRKDPNDLPKNRHNVWITYINAYYQKETTEASFRYKYWVINGHRTECDVIAWCEIPKLEDVSE